MSMDLTDMRNLSESTLTPLLQMYDCNFIKYLTFFLNILLHQTVSVPVKQVLQYQALVMQEPSLTKQCDLLMPYFVKFVRPPHPIGFYWGHQFHGPSPQLTACRSPTCGLTTVTGSNQAQVRQGLDVPLSQLVINFLLLIKH